MAQAPAAEAKPKVTVVERVYTVDATTAQGLREQMKQRGPDGFWAYTDWYVRWTGSCKTTVDIRYILPQHANEAALDPVLRQKWRAMLSALRAHEARHGEHGVKAAQEIEQARCRRGDAIIRKWNDQDSLLDSRTDHGLRDGVVLR